MSTNIYYKHLAQGRVLSVNMSKQLSDIFLSEQNENWEMAISQYEALYRENHSCDVSMHFAFLCWYLLWQWDQISFHGETISPYERMSVDMRNGISKSSLLSHLDAATKQLLSCTETPEKYFVVLLHMKKTYPYFFSDETFVETEAQQLMASIQKSSSVDTGINAICTYLRDSSMEHITSQEKESACNLFPNGSLLQEYFTWLFH